MGPREILTNSEKNSLTHFIKHLLCIEGETNSNTPTTLLGGKNRGEGEGAANLNRPGPLVPVSVTNRD
jgi:hypothetical protein